MKLPDVTHTARPWRIHELAYDFRLEDVWALPTPGGPGDFPRLVQLLAGYDPRRSRSRALRTLFGVRSRIGQLLGWDRPGSDTAAPTPTLRDRVPADLRERPSGPDLEPFSSLYLLEDEWAMEYANPTLHGILHLGWVLGDTGVHRGELAIYVRRRSAVGSAYMAAILPFRYLVVYPAMLRELGSLWRTQETGPAGPAFGRA